MLIVLVLVHNSPLCPVLMFEIADSVLAVRHRSCCELFLALPLVQIAIWLRFFVQTDA
jgi:hypothetical protein